MNKRILALGDCNTLGIKDCRYNSYPERFGRKLGIDVLNCGYTMSTTNEGLNFFNDKYNEKYDYVSIQYGLVDSWKTFKYSPYVLYYPENIFRKISRKIIKKYKKICKKLGLNNILGTKNVVSKDLYLKNLENIIQKAQKSEIILIETPPNQDLSRNQAIQEYNDILKEISKKYDNCHLIEIYDYFLSNINNFYLDETHINSDGYEYISNLMFKRFNNAR